MTSDLQSTLNPQNALALALGVKPGKEGSPCAIAGQSIFDRKTPRAQALKTLGDHDLLAINSPAMFVCAGCMELLGGKPGRDPPPARMRSLLLVDNEITYLDRAGFYNLLLTPPEDRFVLSWASSGKKNHWIHAGWSTAQRLRIGSDDGPIDYIPTLHRKVIEALRQLRSGATKLKPAFTIAQVTSGDYPAARITAFGAHDWFDLERVIAPVRGPLLDLLAWCIPVLPRQEERGEREMAIDPNDQQAADLLGEIALGSQRRVEEGLQFWGGYFRRRVERFAPQPLATCVSRLLDECQVSSATSTRVVGMLRGYDEKATQATEGALRRRGALCVALAFDYVKTERERRKQARKSATKAKVKDLSPIEETEAAAWKELL